MRPIKSSLAVIAILLVSGCANSYQIRVDSISEPGPARGTRYVLVSGMTDVTEADLYFREFASHFRRILANKGYTEVTARAEADLEVALSYGTSHGRAEFYSYSRPIYHVSGGEQIRYREVRTDANGQKTETTGTYYVPLRADVAGYTSELNSQTIYTSYAILEATTIAAGGDAAQKKPLWKTTIRISDPSNDLRHLLPYMAVAGAPYVATNTGASIKVNTPKNDPRVVVSPASQAAK